eukprot:gene3312-3358_t
MATIELSNAGGFFAQPSQRIRLELSERGAASALGNSSAQMAHVKHARLAAWAWCRELQSQKVLDQVKSGLSWLVSHQGILGDLKAQFARRGDLSDAQFLYAEIANRMLDRLTLIRMQPENILDAGCGPGSGITLLKNRYPTARITGQDFNAQALAIAQKMHDQGCDLADTGLVPEALDLIWSNLAVHWHPAPHDVLREWARIVKLNGLVFFSCFGPDTLKEVRQALVTAKLVTQTPSFVDMHDFGDLLVENGFGDPKNFYKMSARWVAIPVRVDEPVWSGANGASD